MYKTLYRKYHLELVAESDEEYQCQQVVKEKIHSSTIACEVNKAFNLNNIPEESVILLCLNSSNYIEGVFEIARGCVSFVTLDIASIFKRALLCNASKIIICHNHPSRRFKTKQS